MVIFFLKLIVGDISALKCLKSINFCFIFVELGSDFISKVSNNVYSR